jgi:signal transduction histidine kinase
MGANSDGVRSDAIRSLIRKENNKVLEAPFHVLFTHAPRRVLEPRSKTDLDHGGHQHDHLLSYFSICVTLFYLARKTRRSIHRDWGYLAVGFALFLAVGFALFIVACGSTHLLEVITTWNPVFWIDAWTNIITAILSGYVAVQLIRKAPDLGFGINDYALRLSNTENEKAQIEESLLAARKLEEWNRMSAVVTHEIANPLAAIQNLMFLIEISPGAAPEVVAMAQRSGEEVRRIESLTRSTLGFFRQTNSPEKVNLRSSADSVRLLLDPCCASAASNSRFAAAATA